MLSSGKRKKISILGVTGSVGQSTLDVILANHDKFDVRCVTAHRDVEGLARDAIRVNAKSAVISDSEKLNVLKNLLNDTNIECAAGAHAIDQCVEGSDIVMAAIMGFAGLRPILHALRNGIDVAIANKEPLVAAGRLIMQTAQKSGARILPVDSEHNAIFQVFERDNINRIERITLTASGGPFLDWPHERTVKASVEEAVKHPNWIMGAKISVDSASMMNKALEVIEAHYLFNLPADKIDVVIHPQSVIHSLVTYSDGSTLAQMGASDMRTPIAFALGWPDRLPRGGDIVTLASLPDLTFMRPDFEQFPALSYAYKCLAYGHAACISLNAANEVAVSHFLERKIAFGDILKCVGFAVDTYYKGKSIVALDTVEEIETYDLNVRNAVSAFIKRDLEG